MRRKTQRKGYIGALAFLAAMGVIAVFVYFSPRFERQAPHIKAPDVLYWNTEAPLKITLWDDTALRTYRIERRRGNETEVVRDERIAGDQKRYTLTLPWRPEYGKRRETTLTFDVTVRDGSWWNFFRGNETRKRFRVYVDAQAPEVRVVANSRKIAKGGSALVVFYARDAHLKHVYVEANGHTFKPQPYREKGYFATLVAWPFTDENFEAKVVAEDKAGNVKKVHIPFYHAVPTYRTSYIKARDGFINGKISELASTDPEFAHLSDKFAKLRAVNETMRLQNEAMIHRLSRHVSDEMLYAWHVKRFYPLKNAKRVAGFGDHRYYYYGERSNVVSESYHVGYDLASIKHADIVASNPGKVVFAGDNGIYGKMPLIDHGLGLYTLYGHCSELLVSRGEEVKRGQVIAKTGMTGLALGDHLHFGMLVQGIEVRPVEWFDPRWIRTFIDDVFADADAIIDKNGT